MKTKLLVLITLCNFIFSHAQTNHYEDLFNNHSTGLSIVDAARSDQSFFYYNVSYRMEALLIMYEKTGDTIYLDYFLKNANRVLNRRDDHRNAVVKPTSVGFSNIVSYNLITNPTWSTKRYNSACPRYDSYAGDTTWHTNNFLTCPEPVCIEIPQTIGNANIIYSFVKFYNIVNANSSLGALEFHHYTQSELGTETYAQIAIDLLDAAEETFDFFEVNWDSTKHAYREHLETGSNYTVPLNYKGARLPLNVQSSMGRVLIEFHKARTGTLEETFYYNRLSQLSNHISLHTSYIPVTDSKRWTYWGYADPKPNGYDDEGDPEFSNGGCPLREDISHSATTVVFPYECYENGLPFFSALDIEQYANTLKNDIYNDVLILNNGVFNGTTIFSPWNFKNNNLDPIISASTNYVYVFWMKYANINPEIYQMLNDFNTSKFYPPSGSTTEFSRNLQSPLTVANLYANQKVFAPIASEHGWGAGSKWVGVDGGNFDGDLLDGDEFAYVRDNDGIIRIGQLNTTNGIDNVAWSINYGSGKDWSNIAAGDFVGDDKDEIVAISNTDTKYYIFKIDGSSIVEEYTSGTSGSISDWVGVAAGDFYGGGKDDFVLARNYNLELKLNTYDTSIGLGGFPATSLTSMPFGLPSTATIVGVASGNLIDDIPGDELVVLINSPSDLSKEGFYILKFNSTSKKFQLVFKKTDFGIAYDWQAITVGDYDADGKDNIIIHGNHDAEYKVYSIDETGINYTIETEESEFFDISQTDGNILGSGNFDINSANNDELISLRNTDGGIIVYTYADRVVTTPRAANSNTDVLFTNPQEITSSDDIKIYPNPTSNNVTINSKNEISSIIVHNLLGENIKLTVKNNVLDVSSLSNGIYILKITFTNGKIINKKIIKN